MSTLHQIRTGCLLIITSILGAGMWMNSASASPRNQIETPGKLSLSKFVYTPIQLPANGEAKDTLSDRDIPTGDGGFARDYAIKLTAGDQVAIDVTSESFDTVVILLTAEGKNVGKNDDGPDGTSNSLLFTRIKDSGTYTVRVQGFGETSSGEFKLKVSKLK
ncbi:PPC domain-containing protein [Chamaesiphon sp. VAR_48_metabat_403]|uniref:PPC domain-containing protein n=1 Tax=Chamaesiphon sp. VAR_48_metabat_403 TaxID=2964700 RepID=UPI00286E78AF|nr:PPC domain-containing protein [Chamaesiphon sp. VAR_48_metabat_403]